MKKILGNEMGFSLIEVMISSALVGVLAICSLKIVDNLNNNLATIDARIAEAELKQNIRVLILDKEACTLTLKERVVGQSVKYIKNALGETRYTSGQSIPEGLLEIESIQTSDKNFFKDTGKSWDKTAYITVIVKTKRLNEKAGGFAKPFKYQILVNAGNSIERCYDQKDKVAIEVCDSFNGNWDGTQCTMPDFNLVTGR